MADINLILYSGLHFQTTLISVLSMSYCSRNHYRLDLAPDLLQAHHPTTLKQPRDRGLQTLGTWLKLNVKLPQMLLGVLAADPQPCLNTTWRQPQAFWSGVSPCSIRLWKHGLSVFIHPGYLWASNKELPSSLTPERRILPLQWGKKCIPKSQAGKQAISLQKWYLWKKV